MVNIGLRQLDEYDLIVCAACNRICRWHTIARLFAVVSLLGNGIFWYGLISLLPILYGRQGLAVAATMTGAGMAGILIYKILKSALARPRPFKVNTTIKLAAMPLDEYSFPSGHTLHAVCFTLIATSYFGELVWVLIPFTMLVAISRVVLGLHYPSDVLAGASLGIVIGISSLSIAM
jgi:undecaprenyl-diphosphatase